MHCMHLRAVTYRIRIDLDFTAIVRTAVARAIIKEKWGIAVNRAVCTARNI